MNTINYNDENTFLLVETGRYYSWFLTDMTKDGKKGRLIIVDNRTGAEKHYKNVRSDIEEEAVKGLTRLWVQENDKYYL